MTIWAEGLSEKWKPDEPAMLGREFDAFNIGYNEKRKINIVNMGDKDYFDVLRDTRIEYFGSLDKWNKAKIKFYDKKVDELGMGEEQ